MSESLACGRLDPGGVNLTLDEQRLLLCVARRALEAFVRNDPLPSLHDDEHAPRLRERRGAFVTLRIDGQLRGCVGCPAHRAPLIQTVQENAVNAASRDPRFPPVPAAELASLRIEISVLSRGDSVDRPFIRMDDPAELVIGRDGLYIEHSSGRTGLLLPQVALEQRWGAAEFLEGICQKARLPAGAWRGKGATLYRFTAEVFRESELLPA